MSDSQPVRVQKFLADSGLCSRRAAEAFVAEGAVWINGERASPGQPVAPGIDKVTLNGKPVRPSAQPRITLAMHKPRGLICTNADPHHTGTIFTVLPREFARFRFFCAGRLDKDSEGLVILTTDGDLANRLMHPSNVVTKHYLVTLKQPFSPGKKSLLLRGVTVAGERLKVERARLLAPRTDGSSAVIDVQMHHGKKREIRQLFTVLGFDVKRLKRYQIGAFVLKGIPLRAVKQLSNKEIALLFRTPRPRGAADDPTADFHED